VNVVGWVVISESGIYGPFPDIAKAAEWLVATRQDVGKATIKSLLEPRKPAPPLDPARQFKVPDPYDPYYPGWRSGR
jgi:hypothetical protein